MTIETGGLLGLILFIANIYAIIKTVQSNITAGHKIMWILLILILPFIGLLLWFFLGPKR